MIEHPLHQAIIAEPDDDEPRLVFADWFEERGDVRGEFIRLQIRLAKMHHSHPDWFGLKQREQTLLKANRSRWNADAHRFLHTTPFSGRVKARHGAIRRWSYQRGFIESLDMDASELVQNWRHAFQLGPVRDLRLFLVRRAMPQLAESECLDRVRTLTLRSDVTANDVISIAGSPQVRHLEELSIPNLGLNLPVATALTESPHLRNLKALDLESSSSWTHPEAVALIAERFGQAVRFQHADDVNRQFLAQHRERARQRRPWILPSLWRRLFG